MRRYHFAGVFFCAVLTTLILSAAPAQGTYVIIYGSPAYTPGMGGYKAGANVCVGDGVAAGNPLKYDALGNIIGMRAVRWDQFGTAVELSGLGTKLDGYTYVKINAANVSGMTAGWADKYDAAGTFFGSRAMRWSADGAVATELQILGTDVDGYAHSEASAVNAAGIAAGIAGKYDQAGNFQGSYAVRWNAVGAVTELGSLGTDATGKAFAHARVINAGGTAAGWANKYDGLGNSLGTRAVRWDAGSTIAVELDNLGTDANGQTGAMARAINADGTIAGRAIRYDALGNSLGIRAVRWDAGSSIVVELDNLGTDANGATNSDVYAVNDAGTTVGYAEKREGPSDWTNVAVRWNATGTGITELGNLGTDVNGHSWSYALDINNGGIVVGYANQYDGQGNLLGIVAAMWGLDDVAIDLNTLIEPAAGWVLTRAQSITDAGWIAGSGMYDPDGLGGQEAYERMWLMQVPAAVPEPAIASLLLAGLLGIRARGRRPRS
ncbi:MAG: DUF3466 family protein [Phycisphaeraceae bacterium]|nr:DUF3466 family protein [Phycisphaeraceae bacterium]